MAGSLAHIIADDGTFTMQHIENLGDAHEALEECHQIIAWLLAPSFVGDPMEALRACCTELHYPVPPAVPKEQERA
jgi:ArsR family metal-binding transcriptional regulator